MRNKKHIKMIEDRYINMVDTYNDIIEKNALFAIDYINYLFDQKKFTIIVDGEHTDYDEYDYNLYMYDKNSKIYKVYEEAIFKKDFISYLIEAFSFKEDSKNKDLVLIFNNSDMHDIYELLKAYSPYKYVESITKLDDDSVITNIGGRIFNVTKRKFIEWTDDNNILEYPLIYTLDYDGTDEKIINLFKRNNITNESFEELMEINAIFDEIYDNGYTSFDLVDFLNGDIDDDEDDYEDDEEDEITFNVKKEDELHQPILRIHNVKK